MPVSFVVAAVFVLQPAPANQPPPVERPLKDLLPKSVLDAAEPAATDTPLRKLQKERVRDRMKAFDLNRELLNFGQYDIPFYEKCVSELVKLSDNLAELVEKPEDKIACYEMQVEAMRSLESFAANRVKSGRSRPQELLQARAARIDAEIELMKVKEAAAKREPAPREPEPVPEAAPDCASWAPATARTSRGLLPLRSRR